MRSRNDRTVPANPGASGLLPGMFPEPQGDRGCRRLIHCALPTTNCRARAARVILRPFRFEWGLHALFECVESAPRHVDNTGFEHTFFELTMDLNEAAIDRLRLKLRYKVLYHVGHNCADVDDLVQETLVRFFRAEQRKIIRNTDELGAFLNGVCRNVILEYRRRIRREPTIDPGYPHSRQRHQAGSGHAGTARCYRQWIEGVSGTRPHDSALSLS